MLRPFPIDKLGDYSHYPLPGNKCLYIHSNLHRWGGIMILDTTSVCVGFSPVKAFGPPPRLLPAHYQVCMDLGCARYNDHLKEHHHILTASTTLFSSYEDITNYLDKLTEDSY